ncbi:phenylacetate-CoA ligase [Chitinophaga sp. CF118]|uniref:phenylacetate--CoA ligase family protein n=1 Tax=Chitinophaga sp. CF118 TaxID=1884367 RepID=UPI0008E7893C|nr:phenylacetate--CoA ligase family protein [Chitinophaga sp. CF118]SFD80761.1 phenylacetate-CoA ligase [Chitinophaga sp. CF118]
MNTVRKMLESIYYRSPSVIKNILVTLHQLYASSKWKGKDYDDDLIFYRKNGKKIQQELELIQLIQLRKLLEESLQFVDFYKQFYPLSKNYDFSSDEQLMAFYYQLPVIEKKTFRTELNKFVNNNPRRKTVFYNKTSGTTGSPMTSPFDKASLIKSFSTWRRFYDFIGLPDRFKTIRFSGKIIVNPHAVTPPFWVEDYSNRRLFLSSYHLKAEYMMHYLEKINEYKPHMIEGYPSAIFIIAKYGQKNNFKLSFKPMAISTTAETLYEEQREVIESFFGCKVYNQYASSEGSPLITECTCGHLHLNIDTGFFEFAHKGKDDSGWDIAEMTVTSFRNLKTPLIRYKIGDLVQLSADGPETGCNCGSNFPYIRGVIGREDDLLFTREKGMIGRMDTAYKGLEGIEKSQILQISENEFVVKMVINADYNVVVKKKFDKNLRERLGNDITIKMETVEDIPLSSNGKFRAVVRLFKLN